MGDRWLPVVGYEGRYEISDLGRVRSLPRKWVDTKGRHGHRKGAFLKHPANDWGYPHVKLYDGKNRFKSFTVAKLVMAAFVGPRPPGMEVCHGDGVAGNSALTNLRYDTPVGNQADRVAHGTHIRGERHPRAKLLEEDVLRIRNIKGTLTQRVIAEQYGISGSRVSLIQSGKSWRHLNAT